MLVSVEKQAISATKSNVAVERSDTFTKLVRRESGAVENCLQKHGDYVWALARAYTASIPEAEALTEQIFAAVWEHAERYDIDICDEKAFISALACRLILRRRLDKHSKI